MRLYVIERMKVCLSDAQNLGGFRELDERVRQVRERTIQAYWEIAGTTVKGLLTQIPMYKYHDQESHDIYDYLPLYNKMMFLVSLHDNWNCTVGGRSAGAMCTVSTITE